MAWLQYNIMMVKNFKRDQIKYWSKCMAKLAEHCTNMVVNILSMLIDHDTHILDNVYVLYIVN